MMVYCCCCCSLLVSHLLAWVGTNTVRVSTRTPLSPASPAASAQFPTRGEFNSGSSSSSCRKLSSLIFFCLTISPTQAAVSGSRGSSSRGSNRSSSSATALLQIQQTPENAVMITINESLPSSLTGARSPENSVPPFSQARGGLRQLQHVPPTPRP